MKMITIIRTNLPLERLAKIPTENPMEVLGSTALFANPNPDTLAADIRMIAREDEYYDRLGQLAEKLVKDQIERNLARVTDDLLGRKADRRFA